MFKVRPMLMNEAAEIGSPGVESVSAAETQDTAVTGTSIEGGTTLEKISGVEDQAAAEPNNFEKAFAKRLSAERAKWEQETSTKFQDYDVAKKSLEFMMRSNGINDPMALNEQIELAELEEKAANQNLTVEELQRRQELEELKAWKQQVTEQQQQQQQQQEFETGLKSFCEGKMLGDKPLNHSELWQYMYEQEIGKPEAAYKAMKADILEKQLENAEKEGVKKFLAAKGSIPTVTGNTSQGQVSSTAPKTFAEARARAMQRFSQ